MVKHVIIWDLKKEFTEEQKKEVAAKVKAGLEGLNGQIPGMNYAKVNIDLLSSSTGSMMLDSEFESEEALKAYQANPKHLAVATFVRSVVEHRSSADYTV